MTDKIPHTALLRDIRAFCAREGIATSTFGQVCLKDRRFVGRLEAGGRCWPETESKVRSFIAAGWPRERANA